MLVTTVVYIIIYSLIIVAASPLCRHQYTDPIRRQFDHRCRILHAPWRSIHRSIRRKRNETNIWVNRSNNVDMVEAQPRLAQPRTTRGRRGIVCWIIRYVACFNQYWYEAEEPQKTASLEVAVNGRYLLEDSYGISGTRFEFTLIEHTPSLDVFHFPDS